MVAELTIFTANIIKSNYAFSYVIIVAMAHKCLATYSVTPDFKLH